MSALKTADRVSHLKNAQKVFEPFYTTRPMGGDQAGMGLVIAKEIVNQHQGFINIDPDYDQGCRFKIGFPLPDRSPGG